MIGQLNFEESVLGMYVVNIARSESVKTIVEIGTLNGMGSTRCVLEGLKNKSDFLFLSYECCEENYDMAVKNNINLLSDKFQIILGKLVDESEVTEWFDEGELSNQQKGWLKADLENMKKVVNAFDTIPPHIDLLIMDGGEFSTYPEYKILKGRTDILALDDTRTFKCKKIKEELLNDDYEVLLNSDERNGVAIFRKLA